MVVDISNRRSREAVEEDVQRLRDWLDKQLHLPHDVEHEILTAFVNGTKGLEIAKHKLDAYYSNRNRGAKLYDEITRDVNAQFRERSKAVNMFFLKNPTPEGYRVLFVTVNDCFDKAFDHPHEAARMLMMLELMMKKWPENTGACMIIDCTGVPSSIITMFSPTTLAASLNCFQDGYPIKLKGVLNINAASFIEFVANNLFKPILKAKLYERIKVVSEGASFLKQYMPLEILPSNYGGNDKSVAELNDEWLNILEENKEWFLLSTRQASDEKKRPPDSENTFGIDGTFRKLAVD
ncbi:retinol-binding protein pinta [Halyomorpha halys]|uniref:retinol-binding protein pinta n=1 Tax=Halyomorpha halys TaxID=286706 RepID=UPI0006D51AC8|nr:alpha-tocopherol transfer protein-like [Halyomorpha halys]